jgi:molecular chaperone DnaJ
LFAKRLRTAKTHEIKAAYRKLALELHPDVTNSCPVKLEKFKLASRAYEILSDQNQRSQYDREYFGFCHYQHYNSGAHGNNSSQCFSQRSRIYAPRPPPNFKRFDHEKWKHYHYGDGLLEEQIEIMKKRAEAAGKSFEESCSPLGRGFCKPKIREQRDNNELWAREDIRQRMQNRVKNRPLRKSQTINTANNFNEENSSACLIM